jgi:hypothetical protein
MAQVWWKGFQCGKTGPTPSKKWVQVVTPHKLFLKASHKHVHFGISALQKPKVLYKILINKEKTKTINTESRKDCQNNAHLMCDILYKKYGV